MLNDGASLQTAVALLIPAFGAATCVTVTVADAFGQGGMPVTVYVYVPGADVPGV
jgi:hypothetical protein